MRAAGAIRLAGRVAYPVHYGCCCPAVPRQTGNRSPAVIMNIRPILLFACVAGLLGLVAPPVSAQPVPPPRFGLFANAYIDSNRTPRTRITAEVPFRHLVFFKKHDLYDARYEVYLQIRHADTGELAGTYVMQGVATVKTYAETRKRDTRGRAWRVISLPPGDYEIAGTLRVKGTRIAMQRVISLRVPDFIAEGIAFGTPSVLRVPADKLVAFARWRDFEREVGHVERGDETLAPFSRQPAVRFALFLDEPSESPVPCDIYYEVIDSRNEQVFYGHRSVTITGRGDEWVVGFDVDTWRPGRYHVNLRAVAQNPERNATASVEIQIDATRAMLTTGFDNTLEVLSIIYSAVDLRALRESTPENREAAWVAFWRDRDPDPTTPQNEALQQYIQRLDYVTEHYSDIEPGWRTDRGRTFLRFGAPEQIERTADQRGQGEYEIWRYYELNRTFVFYDMFGLGDYRLVEGDLY